MSRHAPTVHFTSDLHIGHEKVAGIRGFASTEDHDAAIYARWGGVVADEDKVFVLGDLTGDSRGLDRALDLLAALPGEKHLIAGNHDSCHPMKRSAYKALPQYLRAFESVASAATFKGYGIDVLLSHFPYTADRDGVTRYPQWRLPNLGQWLLHGHTHGTEVVSHYRHPWAAVREIHVGLDAHNLTPVSVSTIADLIATEMSA